MSETRDDGGPAFPRPAGESLKCASSPQEGMTLRDYFASQAMAARIVAIRIGDQPESGHRPDSWTLQDSIAMDAYWMADAMLKERAK